MSKFKVDICNVNTADLQVLSVSEMKDAFIRYQQGDESYKEVLLLGNLKLVLSMVQRFSNRCENMDDLFQVGCIGLVKSIENFDLNHEVRFSTYAVPMILGEIKRYLRDNHQIKISRSLKDIAYKILKIKDEYLNKYQREPTIKELAKKLDVDQSVIIEALLSTNSVASLQEEVKNSDGNSLKMIDSLSDEKAGVLKTNERIDLYDALKSLSQKEHDVIKQRYFEGLSQSEIAKELFISQAQVSRIEKKALNNLHNYLK